MIFYLAWTYTRPHGDVPGTWWVSPECVILWHPRLKVRGLLHYTVLYSFRWWLLRPGSLLPDRLSLAQCACPLSIATTAALHKAH